MGEWYCYILKNDTNFKTYNGSTNDMKRRLRQHNGELTGGAEFTKKYGSNWQIYFLMSGFPDHINCLQAEWKIRYPTGKKPRPNKYNSIEGRIKGINDILNLSKWTSNSTVINSTVNYRIWIVKEYAHLLNNYPSNITVNILDGPCIIVT